MTIEHASTDENELWNKIYPADKANFTMCCSCLDGNYSNLGLVNSHAYTLYGCYEYKGKRLVKIRNPHGEGEWNGDWSDGDSKWTNDMKKNCEFGQDGDDGTFYMSITDF